MKSVRRVRGSLNGALEVAFFCSGRWAAPLPQMAGWRMAWALETFCTVVSYARGNEETQPGEGAALPTRKSVEPTLISGLRGSSSSMIETQGGRKIARRINCRLCYVWGLCPDLIGK